jgi:hypothetical protein
MVQVMSEPPISTPKRTHSGLNSNYPQWSPVPLHSVPRIQWSAHPCSFLLGLHWELEVPPEWLLALQRAWTLLHPLPPENVVHKRCKTPLPSSSSVSVKSTQWCTLGPCRKWRHRSLCHNVFLFGDISLDFDNLDFLSVNWRKYQEFH